MKHYFLVLAILSASITHGYAFTSPISLRIWIKNNQRFSNGDDMRDNDVQLPDVRQLRDLPTEQLLEVISKYDVNCVSDEIKDLINSRAVEQAPNDLEIRMNILGINKLTIAGFVLAAFMFSMNFFRGDGWLGDLLGMNAPIPPMSDATSVYNVENLSKIKELQAGNIIDYEQVLRDLEKR